MSPYFIDRFLAGPIAGYLRKNMSTRPILKHRDYTFQESCFFARVYVAAMRNTQPVIQLTPLKIWSPE
jgi:hypothetical protein